MLKKIPYKVPKKWKSMMEHHLGSSSKVLLRKKKRTKKVKGKMRTEKEKEIDENVWLMLHYLMETLVKGIV